MMSGQARTVDWTACGLSIVDRAVHQVIDNRGCVTASVEAEVQSALDMLRRSRCDRSHLARAERVSTTLFALARSRVSGRINLHESQLLRLTRLAS